MNVAAHLLIWEPPRTSEREPVILSRLRRTCCFAAGQRARAYTRGRDGRSKQTHESAARTHTHTYTARDTQRASQLPASTCLRSVCGLCWWVFQWKGVTERATDGTSTCDGDGMQRQSQTDRRRIVRHSAQLQSPHRRGYSGVPILVPMDMVGN